MYITRDIEKQLLQWKEHGSCALEVEGCRQIGKTTTISKFAKENFKNVIYINLDEESGKRFVSLIRKVREKSALEDFYKSLIMEYAAVARCCFEDSDSTIVIIDEIQESREIYEMIRPFNRNFRFRLLVTGSYLGKDKNFFQPAGDTEKITMYPISFLEFISLFNARSFLEKQDLLHWNNTRDDWYSNAYSVYASLGGYPEVIKSYFEQIVTQSVYDIREILKVKRKILRLVSDELKVHLTSIDDKIMSANFFQYIVSYMLTEKTGKSFIKEFSEYISKNADSFALKSKDVKRCLSWFIECGIIDACDKYDFVTKIQSSIERVYFRDIGILYDILQSSYAHDSDKVGIIAENFVFKTLNENFDGVPQFGVYNTGEIDFVFRKNDIVYGIEVKSGKNIGKTAAKLLNDHKVDKIINFKGNTGGGVADDIITLPIWAAAICQYDFVKTKKNEMQQLKKIDLF